MILRQYFTGILLVLLATLSVGWSASLFAETVWTNLDAKDRPQVHLYFFWSRTCPHCLKARPFIEDLPTRYSWLVLHSHEVSKEQESANLYVRMARELGKTANSVPAFLFCRQMEVGFGSPQTTGRDLEQALQQCYNTSVPATPQTDTPSFSDSPADSVPPKPSVSPVVSPLPSLDLPFMGKVMATQFSLPVFTLIIASLDAFNPCAFFILLFLLSLLIHAGSRWRMLFIGGIFLFFSGLIYFLFMAAWLNLFLWLGEIALITTGAGLVAVVIAIINIKDYFWFKTGISLSIPDSAKPGLFQRMRGLLRVDSLPTLTLGTIALAIAVNAYELLCTAGFPMIYTRVLTLSELSSGAYYAYLVFYNIIYVIPLLVITLVFTFTLGSRKLSESEGRLLKLVSGLMMLGLGILLVAAPDWLNHLWVAVVLVLGAVGLSWGIHRTGPERKTA